MRNRWPIAALLLLGLLGPTIGTRAATSRVRAAAPVPGAPNCPIFPASNVWNQDISKLPVAANSDAMIASIGPTTGLHPDFGSNPAYGIPYNVVSGTQPKVNLTFDYAGESDPGPYPVPANPIVESGSDGHLLIVDKDACRLYEIYNFRGSQAGSGAIWDLNSNALRPDTWTSADAAGLPILPGLARYNEVAAGVIDHALRFTAVHSRNMHIYPARHDAGVANAAYPPMGLRVRLKASVNISGFTPQARVVLAALQRYGMILADNGSNWFVSGASDPGWNDDDLHHLNQITGANLEVVDTSTLVNGGTAATATPTGTSTAAPPTATPTNTPALATSTRTSTPVSTTPTRTNTPVPPTSTPTGASGILTPVADTYVRDGSAAATNFGTATTLFAKLSSTGYNRIAYLRFDLRGITRPISGAVLRLYGRNTGNGTYSGAAAAYPIALTSWQESGPGGITWNSRPALGAASIASAAIGTAAQYYTWDIGAYVRAAQGGQVSVAIAMPSSPSNNSPDAFNAREAGANPPQLLVTTN